MNEQPLGVTLLPVKEALSFRALNCRWKAELKKQRFLHLL